MTNILRTPEFIRAKQRIQKCTSMDELYKLRKAILQYGEPHSDRAELMAYFLEQEQDIIDGSVVAPIIETAADEMSIESIQHKKLSPQ